MSAVTRAVIVLCLLFGLFFVARVAQASWLDDRNAATCQQHGGALYALMEQRITKNMESCTAECFKYLLPCRDGTKFWLTSRWSPEANGDDVFFAGSGAGIYVKILLIAALGFFSFVSPFGNREDVEVSTIVWQNAIVFGLLTLSIMVWGIRATRDGFAMGALVDFPLFIKIGGIILYVAIRTPAFIRGCNYLFIRHPAAAFVSPRGSADIEHLAGALADGASDSGLHTTYHYEHQAQKARNLAASLEEDTRILETRAERERRRAELKEAEAFLEDVRRRAGEQP